MMNLAALTAGVDRPLGTIDETRRLYDYLMRFIEGATLAHYTGDREAKRAEIEDKVSEFDVEFVTPSLQRREALLVAGDDLPKDVLSVLLANEDSLHLPHDVIVREVAFYLLAGAHTWRPRHQGDAQRVHVARAAPGGWRARPYRSVVRPTLHARDGPSPAVIAGRDALGARRHRARSPAARSPRATRSCSICSASTATPRCSESTPTTSTRTA